MKQDIFYQKIEADAFFERHKKNHKTFFESINYKDFAINTKAGFCITTSKLSYGW